MAPRGNKYSPEEIAESKELFLAEYRESGLIREGVKASGASYSTIYIWRREDPEFLAAWERARNNVVGKLEDTAMDLSNGIDEPVFDQNGTQVATKKKYHPSMTMFMLRANDDRYNKAPAQQATNININSEPQEIEINGQKIKF